VRLAAEEGLYGAPTRSEVRGGDSVLALVGTPETTADQMTMWLKQERGREPMVSQSSFPFVPEGLDDVI
jgi:hypothetical protein